MKNPLARTGALVALGALSVGSLALAGPAAADPSPASTSAAAWLTTQLSNGLVSGVSGASQYSLSLDVALAELQGGTPVVATQIRDAVAPGVTGYVENNGVQVAGRTAQVLQVVQATGGNAASFGGINLVTRLEALTDATGKVADSDGNNYSTYAQAVAVSGLAAAKSAEATAATGYLLSQQCAGGYFIPFEGNTCADQASLDTDATAQAVLGLQSQLGTPTVQAAVSKAVAWLKARQAADGSFIGNDAFVPAANANSTGLATAALGASCETSAADRGAAYLRTLQVPAGTTGALANAVGAVAYDQATLADGRTNGIPANDVYSFRFPTAQAALGLVWDPNATSALTVKGPKGGFVKAGDAVDFKVKGVGAGERVCVTTPDGVKALTGTGSDLTVSVKTRRKADQPYTVSATTGPGQATTTVTPLPRVRLKAALRSKVARGDRLDVKISKLAPQEKAKLTLGGKVVARGKANGKGVYKAHFRAALKPGRYKLVVVGAFGNRRTAATFTVTR